MKLLFLTPFLPYAEAPHAVASTVYQWLRRLAERHEVDLLSFVDSAEEAAHRDDLERVCREVVLIRRRVSRPALFYRMLRYPTRPKMYWSFRDPRMERAVRERTGREGYGLVQAEYSQMAQYGPAIFPRTPRLLVKHDVRTVLAWRAWQQARGRGRLSAWWEWLKIPSYELMICQAFDGIAVLSEHNQRVLHGFLPELPVEVIPPGMEIVPADPKRYERPGRVVAFFGAMNRRVNVGAAFYLHRQIMPLVRQAVPGAELHVVGGAPGPEVQALAQDRWVTVTGYVPDTAAYFAGCDLAVAPMQVGGGILTKVLETMAAGLPVVATPVANEGIAAQADREMLLGDDAAALARQVVRFLQDPVLRRRIALAGQELVRRRFGWGTMIERWESFYTEICNRHS
jgi:glycosyltransferase involved in cell wall biosynthesis